MKNLILILVVMFASVLGMKAQTENSATTSQGRSPRHSSLWVGASTYLVSQSELYPGLEIEYFPVEKLSLSAAAGYAYFKTHSDIPKLGETKKTFFKLESTLYFPFAQSTNEAFTIGIDNTFNRSYDAGRRLENWKVFGWKNFISINVGIRAEFFAMGLGFTPSIFVYGKTDKNKSDYEIYDFTAGEEDLYFKIYAKFLFRVVDKYH